MTAMQTDDKQSNGLINITTMDSLKFPSDNTMSVIFTGYYNGFGVEVRSENEVNLLHHMGCFGKGSSSRSKPKENHHGSPVIIRKRQFAKRNYWYKKFGGTKQCSEAAKLLKDIDELTTKIVSDSERQFKDVIDLVSSDDEMSQSSDECHNSLSDVHTNESVVIVPNSDSEGDDYFANLKPKCCLNRIKMQEKLMLTLQEAFFLVYGLGCLQVVNDGRVLNIEQCWELFLNTEKKFTLKYVVYHYFRSKGYIVKPGIKFGGDFLLYKASPDVCHSEYIVVIKNNQDSVDWISTLGHVRMATTTAKEVLIVEVVEPSEDNVNMPEDIKLYSVRELLLNRKIPVTINEDD